jgi:UMF1 family MFS transporter
MARQLLLTRTVICWALYDWANSAFTTSVMVVFFPLVFNRFWSIDATGAESTARLMIANGAASLALAVTAPLLGAIADQGGWRKRFLLAFAACGIAATASLSLAPQGYWMTAASIYCVAAIGFAAANVFYDALLVDVARNGRIDRVSAFGYALGYIGGGLALVLHLVMVLRPQWFWLADSETAMRLVFPTAALWWAVFTTPLAVALREEQRSGPTKASRSVREGVAQLLRTCRRVRELKGLALFLAAYWLYIDGVNTVMKVAVDFGYKLGFGQRDLIIALVIVQFLSFPAALVFGWLGERLGPKRCLLAGLAVYVGVTAWAAFMNAVWEYYVLACAIGLVQGGVFSLSRSYYARLIPSNETAEFFGFYDMIGKFATVLGPFLVAGAAATTGSAHAAIAAILPLLLAGGVLLALTPRPPARVK